MRTSYAQACFVVSFTNNIKWSLLFILIVFTFFFMWFKLHIFGRLIPILFCDKKRCDNFEIAFYAFFRFMFTLNCLRNIATLCMCVCVLYDGRFIFILSKLPAPHQTIFLWCFVRFVPSFHSINKMNLWILCTVWMGQQSAFDHFFISTSHLYTYAIFMAFK